jgi:hypothetical protein
MDEVREGQVRGASSCTGKKVSTVGGQFAWVIPGFFHSPGTSSLHMHFDLQLGRLLHNICCVVPGGVVAFAPSFSYASQLVERWRATGAFARVDAR